MASPKINTAFECAVPVFLGRTLVASPAINAGDVKVSTAAAALNNITTLPTSNVFGFKVNLSAAEMNGAYTLIQFASATTPKPWDDRSVLLIMDTRNTDDLAFPATSGRSMVVDAAGLVDANAVKVGPTGAGTTQTARDLGASVLLSPGTGTGQVDLTAGVPKANATQFAGQTITAAAGVTIPSSIASPTNITAAAGIALANGAITAAKFGVGAIDDTVLASTAAQEIADAVTANATAVPLAANIKKINGTTVNGDGGAVPWGP